MRGGSRALLALFATWGCAQGGNFAGDSGLVPADTGNLPTTNVDTGVPVIPGPGVDAGPPPTGCTDDPLPNECASAMDLGMLIPGSPPLTVTGYLPVLSDEDWFKVTFPPISMPNTFGGGMINVSLTGDATTIFDARVSCMQLAPCGMGENRELTSFSFVDDQSAMVAMDDVVEGGMPNDYNTRDVEWPETLYIRVGKRGGPATCEPYSVTVTRQ